MEPSADGNRESVLENVEKGLTDDHRVSGDVKGSILENNEKCLTDDAMVSGDGIGSLLEDDEKCLADDARVSGDERGSVLENVEKCLTDDARVSGDGIGSLLEEDEKCLRDDARLSGDERGSVLEHVEKCLTDVARVSGDGIGSLLEDDEKCLTDDARVSGDGIRSVLKNDEQGSAGDATVSGDERGSVLENVEKSFTDDAKVSGEDRGSVLENVETDDAKVSEDEIGRVLENVEKGSTDDANRVSVDERGSVLENVEKGSAGDATVSGDERGSVLENVEKHSIDDGRVSGEERGSASENGEKNLTDDAGVSGDERGGVLKNVEKGSTDDATRVSGDERGSVLENVEKGSTDDARVSGDERGSVLEEVEQSLIADARVSKDERGSVRENAEKCATDDARASGDERGSVLERVEKGSNSDTRVSGDERGDVLENAQKGLDENRVNDEEKEGEYKVSDLVWAKVKSYPWWPGQIFDPSASTDKSKKHSKKNGFLIAYFGDKTFAWNDASKIKPFRKNFSEMEKQSKTKGFTNAVNCALDEVSRRVEFGLACSCLSEEVYSKIKTHVFVNSGIREEASKINGGDNFSTVATFKPANVVQSVQDLAKEAFDGISRLEVSTVRAQLLAFYRWKGYHQLSSHHILDNKLEDNAELPSHHILDNKLEDNAELPSMEEDKVVEDTKAASEGQKTLYKRRNSNSSDSIPRKRQNTSNSGSISSKKERRSAPLIPNGSSSLTKKDKKDGGKRKAIECNSLKEESPNRSIDTKSSISSPKKLFRVGDSICKIAKQLSQSPSTLEKEPQISKIPSGKTHVGQKDVERTEENPCGSEITEGSESKSVTVDSSKENSATALILKFTNLDSIPSVTNLNEIFSRFGPVRETETEVLKKSNCAKIVFETQSNAETAFSSAGKFGIFGPALISYRLDYSPVLRKTTSGRKRNRADGESEGNSL